MNCLNCGKKVEQTPGKRAKNYCDPNCRQKHWLKNNKKVSERGPGRPKKQPQTFPTKRDEKATVYIQEDPKYPKPDLNGWNQSDNSATFQSAVKDKKTGGLKVVAHEVAPPPVTVSVNINKPEPESDFDRMMREAEQEVKNKPKK